MGNSHSEKKKVTIIGGSFAGLILLDKIKNDYDITLIEKKDHFEWICSLPHSIIDPQYFRNDATVDLKRCITIDQVFGNNVKYLQGMVTEISDEKSLKYIPTERKDNGDALDGSNEQDLDFDILGKSFQLQFSSISV